MDAPVQCDDEAEQFVGEKSANNFTTLKS